MQYMLCNFNQSIVTIVLSIYIIILYKPNSLTHMYKAAKSKSFDVE